MEIRFRAMAELEPGPRYRELFAQLWPGYQQWFLLEGEARRPGYVLCRRMLRRYLPELVPTWERVTELCGGSDHAARMLSLYRPTPYLTGCSQAVWTRGKPLLVRNYDYHPEQCEGTVLLSAWNGTRVIAMSDCMWGVLDGINEHGLAVSLSFGGRKAVGDGFGIPLILRYVLEFCRTTADGVEVLLRVPSHMSYNVSLLDAQGAHATVHVGPDRMPQVVPGQVATNHQAEIEWTEHAEVTRTRDREAFLNEQLCDENTTAEGFVDAFLRPPLYNTDYRRAFGTLYTAVYRPSALCAEYRWPARSWRQSFDAFDEGDMLVRYRPAPAGEIDPAE